MTIHSISARTPTPNAAGDELRGSDRAATDSSAAIGLTSTPVMGRASAGASGAGSGTSPSPAEAASRRQASDAIMQAFTGSPAALVALVAMQMRGSATAQRGAELRTSENERQTAIRDQERLVQEAVAAATKALADARSGDLWGTVAKVVSVVVSVVVTVCTAGAAAPAAAGALLVAFGDDIANGLVSAGVLGGGDATAFATALKVAGAALMAPATGGLSLVAGGLQIASREIGPLLEQAGVSGDVAGAIATGFGIAASVAGVAAGAAGGTKAASEVQRIVQTAGELATGAARLTQGGFQIDGAAAMHTHDVGEANAQGSRARAELVGAEATGIVDQFRSDMKQVGRLMRIARQAAEARSQASHAAAGGRA